MEPNKPVSRAGVPSARTSLRQVIGSFFYLLIFTAAPFLLAGDWRWAEGWVFSTLFFALSFATVIYLYVKDPALLDERFGAPVQEGQKAWDKILLSALFLGFLAWLAAMPLDARRFGWSPPFPLWAETVGAALYVTGFVAIFGALRENTFAAPVVKVQKERGQKVTSSGLYAAIRHPMYLGGTLLFVGAPLLLASLCGLALGILLAALLAFRSVGEEQMLRRELGGYEAYMKKVRWRIVPFIF